MATLAARLRRARRDAGDPTLQALSSRTGLSKTTLSDALAGHRLPSERTLARLVLALGQDPDAWLEARAAAAAPRAVPAVPAPAAPTTPAAPVPWAELLSAGVAAGIAAWITSAAWSARTKRRSG